MSHGELPNVIDLASELLRQPSITPNDHGCQDILKRYLQMMDFHSEDMPFGDVKNLWARRGTQGPLLVFAGHTDVVPTGPEEQWRYPPFSATQEGDLLYARGAADMKSSIAAMLCACASFLKDNPNPKGSIAFLITSDEEGPSIDGTDKVVDVLAERGEQLDYCIVGEASSVKHLGDTLKIGRRGTMSGDLTVHGVQGHIAYPHLADNPIHRLSPALQALCNEVWDQGSEDFQPTSFQCSNIHSGTGAGNVIPGSLQLKFNFRFCPEVTAEQLQQRVHAILDAHDLNYELTWHLSGQPFLSNKGKLVDACCSVIQEHCGITPELSTGGGTSDGRFIARICPEIIELGPNNASIHKLDEHVSIKELRMLVDLYTHLLRNLC